MLRAYRGSQAIVEQTIVFVVQETRPSDDIKENDPETDGLLVRAIRDEIRHLLGYVA